MSEKIDIVAECNICHSIQMSIFSAIPITNVTRIRMMSYVYEACPQCQQAGDWMLIIRPSRGKLRVVESNSRIGAPNE